MANPMEENPTFERPPLNPARVLFHSLVLAAIIRA